MARNKKRRKQLLYITPPTPFDKFYTFWEKKIKISNTGGLSTGAILGIVFGVIGFIAIIAVIIICCRRKRYYEPEIPLNNTAQQPIYQTYQPPAPIYPPPGPVYQPPAQAYPQVYPTNQPVYSNPPNYI